MSRKIDDGNCKSTQRRAVNPIPPIFLRRIQRPIRLPYEILEPRRTFPPRIRERHSHARRHVDRRLAIVFSRLSSGIAARKRLAHKPGWWRLHRSVGQAVDEELFFPQRDISFDVSYRR